MMRADCECAFVCVCVCVREQATGTEVFMHADALYVLIFRWALKLTSTRLGSAHFAAGAATLAVGIHGDTSTGVLNVDLLKLALSYAPFSVCGYSTAIGTLSTYVDLS